MNKTAKNIHGAWAGLVKRFGFLFHTTKSRHQYENIVAKIAALSESYSPGSPPITPEELAKHFDETWYRRHYSDVARAKIDPLVHYIEFGHSEYRDPSPNLGTKWYATHNEDVCPSDGNGLVHYIIRRFRENRPLVALFVYSWNGEFNIDPYIKRIIATISAFGFNVDVYIGNEITRRDGVKGTRDPADEGRIAELLSRKNYEFAISFNNSLVLPQVIAAINCRIVSVIVDSKSHLFDHYENGNRETYALNAIFAPIYTSLVDELRERYPANAKNFVFMPAATVVGSRPTGRFRKDCATISWIASLVGDGRLDDFLLKISGSPDLKEALRVCVEIIERVGSLEGEQSAEESAAALARAANWSAEQLEQQLQNIVTNNGRIEVVNRLAPLGLKLYGNDRWKQIMPYNSAVIKSFHSAQDIVSHADLMDVYNNSLISINWPQAQAGTGIQYRVLDVVASKSLLITKYVAGSDLGNLFGERHPIETYSDLDELVSKCKFFMDHEDIRSARVAACNNLVSQGYSFEERVRDYLTMSNAAAASTYLSRSPSSTGSVAMVKLSNLVESITPPV